MSEQAPTPVVAAVEGPLDEAVVRRLLAAAPLPVDAVYGRQGKDHLLHNLRGYNHAARYRPWVVLIDLDSDAECAPPALHQWLPAPAPHMHLRVVVRAVEAWLLADADRLAGFLRVGRTHVPPRPESVQNPKRLLVDLARRSRKRDVLEDIVPRPGSGRAVGPGYSSRMRKFVQDAWRPDVAAERADSLRRCLHRIHALASETR